MAKKQDSYYFDTFIAAVECGCRAADILNDTLHNFNPDTLKEKLEAIHVEEHAADCKKHDLLATLIKAFITPIEREDIILLGHNIDDLVDQIEDVLIRVYCHNVQTIRPEALQMSELVVKSCHAVLDLMKAFPGFKHPEKLREHVVRINGLEEEADALYISNLRALHTACANPLEVMAWHELYTFLEQCMDTCEHIADTVESIVMKNS